MLFAVVAVGSVRYSDKVLTAWHGTSVVFGDGDLVVRTVVHCSLNVVAVGSVRYRDEAGPCSHHMCGRA